MAQRGQRAPSRERRANTRPRLGEERPREDAPVGAAVENGCVGEPSDRLLGRVRDRSDDTGETARGGDCGALRVDSGSAGTERQLAAIDRVVDDDAGVADDPREGSGNAEGLVLPEHGPVRVHDAPGCDEGPWCEPGDERPGEPEGDEAPLGERQAGLEPDACSSGPSTPSGALFHSERAGERERPSRLPKENPFQNEALSRRAALVGAMQRPRLRR